MTSNLELKNSFTNENYTSYFGDEFKLVFDKSIFNTSITGATDSFWGNMKLSTGLSIAGDVVGGISAVNNLQNKADYYREQAKLEDARAVEIQRRTAESIDMTKGTLSKVLKKQSSVLGGMNISVSGTLAQAQAAEASDAAYEEIARTEKAGKYEYDLARAKARSARQAADDAEGDIFGTVLGTAIAIGTTIVTGNPYAGMAAGKASTALLT